MSTVLVETNVSCIISTPVDLFNEDYDTASQWASKHIVRHPALKWIVGKYVEADNANGNGQFWELGDLRVSKASLAHTPLNLNHMSSKVVGTIVAGELVYPLASVDEANEDHPFIETVSAFWRHRNPDDFEMIEAAYQQGMLTQSMECVARSLTCMEELCGEEFAYQGPVHESYCAHMQGGGIRKFNDPLFLGGALIVPPVRPGWRDAEVTDIAHQIMQTEQAADVYEQVKESAPDLGPEQWESMMLTLLISAQSSAAERRSPRSIGRDVLRTRARYGFPQLSGS